MYQRKKHTNLKIQHSHLMCVLKISFSRNNFIKIILFFIYSLISGSSKNLKKCKKVQKPIF